MKVNVKFANDNGMAFLGQGYITKTECYYQYQLMAQLEIALKLMNFKLL